VQDFHSKVIPVSELMNTDADLNKGERIAAGKSKPRFLHIFLLRTNKKMPFHTT
jgi:hypothetical protein